jgi:hypothetical protein
MRERELLILIVGVTLLIAPATLSAQIEDAAPDLIFVAHDLDAGARLRFETRSSGVGSGSFVRVEPTGLFWADSTGQSARIEAEDLLRLEVRRPAWRKGARIGATAGVVVGLLGGWLYGFGCECPSNPAKHMAVGAVSYGLGGGALGAALGSAFQEWHTILSR